MPRKKQAAPAEEPKKNPFGYTFTTSVLLPNGGRMTVEGHVSELEMTYSKVPKMVVGATLTAQAIRIMEDLQMLGVIKDVKHGEE